MWAQRLVAPQRFAACETPAPSADALAPGQVLLDVAAGGVCGSDLPFFRGAAAPDTAGARAGFGDPGFPMHEVAGRVLASRHPEIAVGDDVVGWASGFDGIAELAVCAGDGLHRHRADVAPETAVLLQPLACVLYAVEQVRPLAGLSVAVIGQGPIGLLFSHVAKAAGAARVVGVDRVDRSDLGPAFGVDEVVHASSDAWALDLPAGERPEVVFEAIGHQSATLNHAVDAVGFGGEIFYFGVADETSYPFAMRSFLRKNLTLRSGVTLERRRVLAAADEYLVRHPSLARDYVTHVVPADDAQKAFDLAVAPAGGQAKIVLSMR
ncbi:threonine dehydrogenase-like Zn-dependent dehydrogenase [Pseudonocardia sediminis]|uniref:Threonine dehydrogenase-like Zn-dependent dehydrogenase n=1 Tax=Pseudonocardia sediminis TaxID=1397368 RepID=A0A4Q7UWP2_PSEST|nr:zinc-binding dehydrogenase [Pseudonocardia sediminis]RZT84593.1 threonine dehydrogenase-like Zn-dependent dehydrogenase [Pseudonocardia sediminis]